MRSEYPGFAGLEFGDVQRVELRLGIANRQEFAIAADGRVRLEAAEAAVGEQPEAAAPRGTHRENQLRGEPVLPAEGAEMVAVEAHQAFAAAHPEHAVGSGDDATDGIAGKPLASGEDFDLADVAPHGGNQQ